MYWTFHIDSELLAVGTTPTIAATITETYSFAVGGFFDVGTAPPSPINSIIAL
jgi:hypothetical protein